MCVPCVQEAKALNFDNTGNVTLRIRAVGRLFTWLVPQERALFLDRALIRDRALIVERALTPDRVGR